MDPYRDFKSDQWLLVQVVFFMGASSAVAGIVIMIANINMKYSCFLIWCYNISLLIFVMQNEYLSQLTMSLIQAMIGIFFSLFVWTLTCENTSKQNFMSKKKIERLLNEQQILLDNIPDGAIIFKHNITNQHKKDQSSDQECNEKLEVRYLNPTINEMFS
jgi:hypothetical protein